jgi:hypothetical protein
MPAQAQALPLQLLAQTEKATAQYGEVKSRAFQVDSQLPIRMKKHICLEPNFYETEGQGED